MIRVQTNFLLAASHFQAIDCSSVTYNCAIDAARFRGFSEILEKT
jgi:hypothetical protein